MHTKAAGKTGGLFCLADGFLAYGPTIVGRAPFRPQAGLH